ncbi:MAG: hypothetical protein ACSLEW_15090 [Nocardioides sp.]
MHVEWFSATSGRVIGWVGIVIGVLAAATTLVQSGDPAWMAFGAVVSCAAWVALLRPRIGATDEELLLRGMVSTVAIGWGSVRTIAVSRFTAVWVGDKRYVCPAVGHSLRAAVRTPGRIADRRPTDYASHVEAQLRRRMEDALVKNPAGTTDEVRRIWAWPEIAALSVSATAMVILLAV